MPIQKCRKKGKQGYQWGSQKCYTGSNAKKKAKQQRQAAYASGYKK
jgi:hypothetical protein